MKKLCFYLMLLLATNCFSQTDQKLSAFISFQANKTLNDRIFPNKTGIAGLGLQTYLNTKAVIKPTLEINADFFSERRAGADDKPYKSIIGIASIYAGPFYQPTERVFLAATVGSALYNRKIHFGMRPSIGIYLSGNKKWAAKAAYKNIFQKDGVSNKDFGYMSVALAFKL